MITLALTVNGAPREVTAAPLLCVPQRHLGDAPHQRAASVMGQLGESADRRIPSLAHQALHRGCARDSRCRTEDIPHRGKVRRSASLFNVGDRSALLAHPKVLEFSDLSVREKRTRAAIVDGQLVGFATAVDTDGGLEL